jgi:hypothetical protein
MSLTYFFAVALSSFYLATLLKFSSQVSHQIWQGNRI